MISRLWLAGGYVLVGLVVLTVVAGCVTSYLWTYHYIDTQSGQVKDIVRLGSFTLRDSGAQDTDDARWVRSRVGVLTAQWRLIGGNPLLGRGCALGQAWPNKNALQMCHLVAARQPEAADRLLHEYLAQPFPLPRDFRAAVDKAVENSLY